MTTQVKHTALVGRRIVMTRATDQMSEFRGILEQVGAIPLEVPTLSFKPPAELKAVDRAVDGIRNYNVVVFTSVNAVRFFLERLKERGDLTDLEGRTLCAIGPKTAHRLKEYGFHVDVTPQDARRAEELLNEIQLRVPLKGAKILFPRAEEGREILPDELRKSGARVDVVSVYRTVAAQEGPALLQELIYGEAPHWITFASGSAVRHFFSFGPTDEIRSWMQRHGIRVAVIGQVTADEVSRLGFRVDAVSTESTLEAMVAAIERVETKGRA